MVMLTGRTPLPSGFDSRKPKPTDWPSIASIAGAVMPRRNNLPPAVALPEKLVHVSGRVIPGQFAGMLGPANDPWLVEASRFRSSRYIHGAFPEYTFERRTGAYELKDYVFEAPGLTLPEDVFETAAIIEPRQRIDLGLHFHLACSGGVDSRQITEQLQRRCAGLTFRGSVVGKPDDLVASPLLGQCQHLRSCRV